MVDHKPFEKSPLLLMISEIWQQLKLIIMECTFSRKLWDCVSLGKPGRRWGCFPQKNVAYLQFLGRCIKSYKAGQWKLLLFNSLWQLGRGHCSEFCLSEFTPAVLPAPARGVSTILAHTVLTRTLGHRGVPGPWTWPCAHKQPLCDWPHSDYIPYSVQLEDWEILRKKSS